MNFFYKLSVFEIKKKIEKMTMKVADITPGL